jgi:sulfite reductase alpha subunit-like flavoprotein
MPTDVTSAFEEIVSKENEVSREDAVRWIRSLEKCGKFHIEAWS